MEQAIPVIKKERDSNLELYRIITMLLIVAHHYVVNSGLLQLMQTSETTFNNVFLYVFGMWGKTGINCFMLITGYFMCKSSITLRKFLKLILEVEFYKIVIYLIFLISGYEAFSLKGLIKSLLPISSVSGGFTSCFLLFFLCIPFLNILIKNLTKAMHQRLLLLSLGIYTILYTLPGIYVSYNYVSWFCVLYFISSYIRIYGFFPKISTTQWGWLSLLSVVLSVSSVLCLINTSHTFWLVSDSNAALALTTAVCSFMFFKGLKIKQSKTINLIGGSTFGVLLIHANSDTMRRWLWKDTLDNVAWFNSDSLVFHAVVSVVVIFAVCIIIDRIRILTVERYIFNYIDKLLAKYNVK